MSQHPYLKRLKFDWLDLYDTVRDPRAAIKAWTATLATFLVGLLGDVGIPLPDAFPAALESVLMALGLGFFAWLLPNYPRAERDDDTTRENNRFYGS